MACLDHGAIGKGEDHQVAAAFDPVQAAPERQVAACCLETLRQGPGQFFHAVIECALGAATQIGVEQIDGADVFVEHAGVT